MAAALTMVTITLISACRAEPCGLLVMWVPTRLKPMATTLHGVRLSLRLPTLGLPTNIAMARTTNLPSTATWQALATMVSRIPILFCARMTMPLLPIGAIALARLPMRNGKSCGLTRLMNGPHGTVSMAGLSKLRIAIIVYSFPLEAIIGLRLSTVSVPMATTGQAHSTLRVRAMHCTASSIQAITLQVPMTAVSVILSVLFSPQIKTDRSCANPYFTE